MAGTGQFFKLTVKLGLATCLLGIGLLLSKLQVQTVAPGLRLAHTSAHDQALALADVPLVQTGVAWLLRQHGPVAAYQQVKAAVSNYDLGVQHDVAHIFGESLVVETDISGLSICDHSMANGCYHGFLLALISQEGLAIVPELGQRCLAEESPLSCQHGIGHGLAEYFGPDRFSETTAVCNQLPWDRPLLGCVGGAVMEHHFPSSLGQGQTVWQVLPFDEANPFQPCSQLTGLAFTGCVFHMPRWWKSVISYPEIDALCAGLPDEPSSEWCYRGVGFTATRHMVFSPEEVRARCAEMTGPGVAWCQLGAVWGFRTSFTAKDRAHWPKFCPGLVADEATAEQQATCWAAADVLAMWGN